MPKHTPSFYTIRNESKDDKTVDILIYGNIPGWDEEAWKMKNTADQFVRDFQKLEKDYDRINIHINSPGGSLYHAFPIFNIIKASKKDIHTYNDGIAASAASVLLMAGKRVHSAKNGMVMIHNALNWLYGNAQELREAADVLEKYDGVIADHYAQVSGKTKEEILADYFDYKDHWLTAEEAKEQGLIHEIEDYESEDAPPSNISAMAFDEVMNFYRQKEGQQENILVRMANRLRIIFTSPENQDTPPADPPTLSPIPTNTDTMDFKNSLGILAKSQLAPEDVAAIKAEIEAFIGANEKFTAEEVSNKVNDAIAPLNVQITNLTTEKNNLATQVTSLSLDIQAYRASGVKPTNAGGEKPNPITGTEAVDGIYSETDELVKQARAQAGIVAATK